MSNVGPRSVTVKIGGAAGVDTDRVCADVARLTADGARVIVVHGGSNEVDRLATRLGCAGKTLTSAAGYETRHTDAATMELILAAIAGTVNKHLVHALARAGVRAIGLSGLDGRLIEARRKPAVRVRDGQRVRAVRDDLSGTIERVDHALLDRLLAGGYVPVVGPPVISTDDEILNVNADRIAAAVAAAAATEWLVLLSNVPGLLRDLADPTSLVPRITFEELGPHLAAAEGGMKMKLEAARQALAAGVPRVVIGDSRIDRPLLQAIGGTQGTGLARWAA